MGSIDVGDLLYEYSVKLTGMTDYGVDFGAVLAGNVAPPLEGARFDVPFDGPVTGPKLKGRLTGQDYLRLRADGRFDLHIHGQIATDDGARIAFFADGVALPRQGSAVVDLRENVNLWTSFPQYAWVNRLQIWATGTADLSEMVVRIKGYAA